MSDTDQAQPTLKVGDRVQTPRNLGDGYGRAGIVTDVYPGGAAVVVFPGGSVSCRGWQLHARRNDVNYVVPYMRPDTAANYAKLGIRLESVHLDYPGLELEKPEAQ